MQHICMIFVIRTSHPADVSQLDYIRINIEYMNFDSSNNCDFPVIEIVHLTFVAYSTKIKF